MGKTIFMSKTFWVSVFVFVAGVLKLAGVVDLPVDADAAWIGIAWGLVQFLLRLVTKEPVVKKQ